jgi:hypothetical protein
MESRKHARRGPRFRSSKRAESEGFECKEEGPRPMQGGGPRVQGRGRGFQRLTKEEAEDKKGRAEGLKGLRAASNLSKIYTTKENFRSRIKMPNKD